MDTNFSFNNRMRCMNFSWLSINQMLVSIVWFEIYVSLNGIGLIYHNHSYIVDIDQLYEINKCWKNNFLGNFMERPRTYSKSFITSRCTGLQNNPQNPKPQSSLYFTTWIQNWQQKKNLFEIWCWLVDIYTQASNKYGY